jgi:heme-degrading monooxygenase HmoA
VKVTGCEMFHLANGKVVETWDYVDRLGMNHQLGYKILPPLTPSTFAMVSEAQVKPEKMNDLLKLENEMSAPLLKSYKEFHGLFFLGDVKTGKVFSVSIWDSQDTWLSGMKEEKVKAFFKDFSAKTKDFFAVKPAMTGYRVLMQE